MDSLKILEDLVEIRSDKHAKPLGGIVEYGVATYLERYVEKHFPHLKVEMQEVETGRYNLFVHDGTEPTLLFMGHMDTVEEGLGWRHSVRGELEGKRFYGRGSADMKSGIVAILAALDQAQKIGKKGIAALFYCDEEYDFLGAKKFIKEYADRFNPKLIICPEATLEEIRAGCRGITEVKCVIEGVSGHAARPDTGVSAFEGAEAGLNALRKAVNDVENELLGKPTLNIATIRCGSLQKEVHFMDSGPILGKKGNVIPNYCELMFEVRTIPEFGHDDVLETFKNGLKKHRAILKSCETQLNLGSYVTDREHLKLIEEMQEEVMGAVKYEDPGRSGYTDVQILNEIWGCPAINFGPKGKNMHGTDEYVEIPSFERLERAFRLLVDKWA